MSFNYNHQLFKKSHVRHSKRKLRRVCTKIPLSKRKYSPANNHLQQILSDLQQPGTKFLSYTVTELEPICHQIAIQQMSSSSSRSVTTCPLICLFCENLIYEPITLYCGHTYCGQCMKDEESSISSLNCPRCSSDIQGQIQSSIIYAREKQFSKNVLLQQILERSETFKSKRETILLCHKAQNQYTDKNYQQAIDIYSNIIEKYDDDHMAYYGRAKTYIALKQFDQALNDIERVIQLKPHWARGYYCRSEILFAMKYFTAALLSSLHGLSLDPEDQLGKQIMAQHLHAVLHDSDDKKSAIEMETRETIFSSLNRNTTEIMSSKPNSTRLLLCKPEQSLSSCLCPLFDYENLSARDFECSVCVNLLWFPITTPCGHVFCRECLIRSIDNTHAQCPMCKSSLEEFFPMLIQSHVNKTEIVSQIIETYFPNEYNERKQLHEQETIQGALIPKLLTNSTESVIFEIPIFVCVLALPHCTCPLHVFEPRYRLMMRRAIETQSRTFGMCTYDEETDTYADYGTLLYIRGFMYTQDGRSIVDTIGRRRFRVIDRDMKDGYDVARVQLIQDVPIEQQEFDELYQLNRTTYDRVRVWFDQLDAYRQTLISRQLGEYPSCDDLIPGSTDGPSWSWIMLNFLPIKPDFQYQALTSQSFRTRLQMINDTIDFLFSQQQQQSQQMTESTSNQE